LTYRVRKAALQTWVVWVDAKDQASFEASYRKFAKAVQLPGWDEQNTDVLTLVHDWLNDETNGPWIMVLDSVDDTNTLTAPVRDSKKMSNGLEPLLLPQIREFIPISQKGSILATSTNVDAAQLITGNCADHIDVGEMSEDEALALLKSKLHRKVIYTDDDARELVKAAEYMPLAISQLAARISIEFPRLTLSQATDKLNNPDQDATRLLEGSAHELNRDVRRTNSVVKSWHLSFQYVREKSPSAARLLSLMCLFDRQGISETLLVGEYGEEVIASTQPHLPWWNRIRKRALHKRKRIAAREDATSVKKHNFDADWRILNSLMLVKTSIGGHHFNMHRLVQYTTRRWLEVHGELEAWMKKYVMILRSYFPLPDYQHFEESHFKDSHFEACQYLFPHTQHVASYRPTDLATLRRWASLLLDISLFAHHQGNNTAAEKLGRVALAMLDELVEERNKYTLRCLNQLGVALQALNKYQEAESLLRRAWKGREALLGPDHLDTIDSAYRLGDVLNVQQKWDEGEAIEMQVLEGCGRVYGATHIDTLSLMSRMAFGCIVNGRYKQAERLHRRVFEIRRTASGEQSEQAYQYMQGLARLLNMQGEAAEAEVLQQQVVKAGEARSGLHYSGTIQSINLLGEVLIKRGKFEEAAALLNRVLEIYADLNVQAREQACFCLNNLAEVYLQQGKLSEAECVGRNLIEQWETLLGSDHVDTLVGVHTLADILTQQERFEDALELYERAYRGTEQRCGAEHSDTVRFLNDFNTAKIRALAWPVLNIRDSLESNKTTELVFLPPMLTASQSSALIMA
jgi:tetratricopeptide (TPR) repeat protein